MSKRIDEKDLKYKVRKFIKDNELIKAGDKIVLAVSGGPDSLCMLDLFCYFKENKIFNFEFVVAHVNHMIRDEAEEDAEFVRNYCKQKNVEFYLENIDVKEIADKTRCGLEETGRKVRYDFFNKILTNKMFNKIAIAHNKNDVAETILMNIFRGSGITGLKGIEPISGQYIRPLLDCERLEIEQYCEKYNLNPRIDRTNFENLYTRNKIRNIVMPYIKKEFNPNIIQTMYRLSNLVQEEEKYINDVVAEKYTEIMILEDIEQKNILQSENKIILSLKKFNTLEKVIKSKVILYTISRLIGNSKGIEKVHIDDIIKLCDNNIGNKYLMPNKNLKVLVKNGQIYFIHKS